MTGHRYITTALVFLAAAAAAMPAVTAAWDAGPSKCKHNVCSGGALAFQDVLDTRLEWANSVIPGRVADCPAGYTNLGITCSRGARTIRAPSRVSSCPGGYTNIGLFCSRPPSTYGKGCTTIFKKYRCRAGYTDNGCFCGRSGSTLPTSRMTCPGGYFLNKNLGRCYKRCPGGYTNTGETCSRGVRTLGASAMTCRSREERRGGRCFPRGRTCSSDREAYGGLCYKRCPRGSRRTAVSTCVHSVKWRGNTHLWVVNGALALLQRSGAAEAKVAVAALSAPACRTAWEEGLWGEDEPGRADNPLSSDRGGAHFYNARRVDFKGKGTSSTTYKGAREGSNAKEEMQAQLKELGSLAKPSVETCRKVGAALHYVTDMMPFHASGFSGLQLPLMLHPVTEYYVPTVQARYPPMGAWDRQGAGKGVDAAFDHASTANNRLAPALLKVLTRSSSICSITPEFGITYTGYCFVNDPRVDGQIGVALRLGYQTTATWIAELFRTKALK